MTTILDLRRIFLPFLLLIGVSFALPVSLLGALTSAQAKELKLALRAESLRFSEQKATILRRSQADLKAKLIDVRKQLDAALEGVKDSAQAKSIRARYAQEEKKVKIASAEALRAELEQAEKDLAFNYAEIKRSYGVQ